MIHTEQVEYSDGNVICKGYLAFNTDVPSPRPCVLVAPDWGGRGKQACQKAEQLAAMGYVGFAIDMYGDAKTANSKEEKNKLLQSIVNDRQKLAVRINAALQAAKNHKQVDPHQIAAMGYCFGGLCVLDLARSGAEVNGVISFHGLLHAPETSVCNKIKAKVLVLHGYKDPLAPPKEVEHFAKEMSAKKVDWQIHWYGSIEHAFTNPEANDPEMGLQYNALADRRSWTSATNFLKELFNASHTIYP